VAARSALERHTFTTGAAASGSAAIERSIKGCQP
jgi:hypothetical protein